MKNKQWILSTLVCLLPILAYLAVYDQLPEMMPIHFNAEGVADNFITYEKFTDTVTVDSKHKYYLRRMCVLEVQVHTHEAILFCK